MRRIFAFVVMVVTILSIIIVGLPSLDENKNLGIDFKGGFEILYEVSPLEGSEVEAKDIASAAASGIEKRLEIANVSSYFVEKEGSNFIRVGVATSSATEVNNIKEIIEKNSEISFRDFQNNLLATGEEILAENAASVSSSPDQSGYYYIDLNISDTDKLGEITGNVASLSDTHLVIWLGFEEGDDYANRGTDANIQSKIIYDATVSEALYDKKISVTGQFSREYASQTADLINSGTYEFEMAYRQLNQVDATLGSESFNKTLIAFVIALAVVLISLIVIYRGSGLISSFSLLFSVYLSLTLFNLTNGVYNVSSIAALLVGILLSIDAIVVVLERVKKEIYAGKDLLKVFSEGFKKAFTSILDANIATFIVAVIAFFVGSSVLKSFSSMMLVTIASGIFTMLIINPILISVYSNTKLVKSISFFGAKKKFVKLEENQDKIVILENKKIINFSKKYLLGFTTFVSISLITMLIFNFVLKQDYFNFGREFREGSRVSIETKMNYFADEQAVNDFLSSEGIELEASLVSISAVTDPEDLVTSYVVSMEFDTNISDKQMSIDAKLEEIFGENTTIDTNYKLYVQATSAESTLIAFQNAFYTVLIISLVVALYLTFRYRYTYGVAIFATIFQSLLSLIAVFALFRIQVESLFIPLLLAIVSFNVNSIVVIFSRMKEFLVFKKAVYVSNDERLKAISSSLKASVSRYLIGGIVSTLFLLVFVIISPSTTLIFNVALVVGIVLSIAASFFVAPYVWLVLEKRKDRKQRTFKPKKENPLFKDVEEKTFIGIND